MEEALILIIIALVSIILYLAFRLINKLKQLDVELNSNSAKTAWRLYERTLSKNLEFEWKTKELKAFKEAVEYFIENEPIAEAYDKIKELVQSFKKTDTSTNN